MKLWEVFRFELYCQLRRPSTWIHFVAVVGLILLVVDELVEYARTVEELLLNAPMTVANLTGFSNKFGLLLVAALVGNGAMRDIQARMDPLLYTSSLSKMAYLGGRFLGTFSIAGVLLIMVVPLSLLIAYFTMGLEPALFGPLRAMAYLHSSLFLTLPNAFVATALLYALVLLSRNTMAAYVGGLIIFIVSTFSVEIAGNWSLAKLIDPVGITVIDVWRRSLPPLQINTALIEFKGFLLANRALWIGISVLVAITAYFRFRLSHFTPGFRWKRTASAKTEAPEMDQTAPVKMITAFRTFNYKTRIYQTCALAVHFFREMMMSRAGLIIPAVAIITFLLIAILNKGPLSFPILPTTARITFFMNQAAIKVMVVMLITLFAGQLIWRERDARLSEISDAVPVPDSVLIISKYAGLALVLVALQLALMVAGIAVQVLKGYYQLEIEAYLQVLFGFQLPDYLLFAAVAMAIHILVNQKYVGHLVVFFFYLYTLMPASLGIEHKLLIFGSDPGLASSTFYDQSAFLIPWLLFKLYWVGWTLLLMVMAKNMWVRGREAGLRLRVQQAFQGLSRSPLLFSSLVLLISMGAFLFYNTNILNEYNTVAEKIEQQVDYERIYGKYEGTPQPHLTGSTLHIEFYPDRREAVVQGAFQLKNSSGSPIDSIHVALAPEVETSGINFNRRAKAMLQDKKLGHHVYLLEQPLQPGDSLQMRYEVHFKPQGFSNGGMATAVMDNGTWIRNWEWFPSIGYQTSRELSNDRMRKGYGLPKRKEMGSLTHMAAVMDRTGRERIRFEATIGTAADQIAVAPGALKRTWSEGGRRYFHYVADEPIWYMFHLYSAKYEVHEAQWKDINLQIFHQPQNRLNLERMEQAMKASLDYYSKNFSPYPYRQLKMVESPESGTSGISLPGTIGYTTNFSLLNPEGDSRGFDLPFAVVAHEVAHQWWGHQLIPAYVEGVPLITESLAWYSALGVVEQRYGQEHLQNLLNAMRKAYLHPRSRAALPLLKSVDIKFDGYRKGPFATYALREYVGEEQVNRALRNLLNKFGSGEPPYATSLDFYAEIQEVTPDSLHYLLRDLFEANTFWELETKKAGIELADEGNWLVSVEVFARKVTVDTAGKEREVPMDDLIEIGVFGNGKEGIHNALYLKKQRIHSGANRIVVKVPEKPEAAGIDPRNLLIDTEVHDNVKRVIRNN